MRPAGPAALALALVAPAAAAAAGCRLALVLALDVSSSVDAAEYHLQRDGLAKALMAPEVAALILDLDAGPVAIAAFEWSGRNQQVLLAGWVEIGDRATLEALAARIAATERSHDNFPTALGHALGFGATLMRSAPDCARRVIDVSGDGVNNESFPPAMAYAAFPFDGITVNGLAIGGTGFELPQYYRSQVIRGPGAFVELAEDYRDFATAMARKLVREIGVVFVGGTPGAGAGGRGRSGG
ncbi:MAG: hypothetical protein CVT84_12645 [Alphaproteobacteria bacterium HGW-Alphaproteobacteria-6]|nr:MAG: hypothetical protein CVT84_12645 [Alphaproteobacteria bacterium HGW-Alphaproteobacteria-6]